MFCAVVVAVTAAIAETTAVTVTITAAVAATTAVAVTVTAAVATTVAVTAVTAIATIKKCKSRNSNDCCLIVPFFPFSLSKRILYLLFN